MTMKIVIEEKKRFVYGNYYIKLLYSMYMYTEKSNEKICSENHKRFFSIQFLAPIKALNPLRLT